MGGKLVVKPRIRGFICTTAHPLGCFRNVEDQIKYVTSHSNVNGPKNVLVIGSSGGYGLASRIVAAYGCGASTLGISLEKQPSDTKTASAGWYNNLAFDRLAKANGLASHTINGDAFSKEIKNEAVAAIKAGMGKIDLLVYSLAAPVRVHPETQERFRSTIKPLGQPFQANNLVLDVMNHTGKLVTVNIEPADEEETKATVAVMGGEDWQMWMDRLHEEQLLTDDFVTVAFTYLGNELTQPIYRGGTLGKAKEDLDLICGVLNDQYDEIGVKAYVAVLKAVVTQASTAIPVVPLYFSMLFKVMKEQGTHEGCIDHIYRLFHEQLYSNEPTRVDEEGRIRMDNFELTNEVQDVVKERWATLEDQNLHSFADIEGFSREFLKLFGFGRTDIDYEQDIDPLFGSSPL